MTIEDFMQNMLEDLRISSTSELSDIQTEFVKYVVDILIDAEEFDDFVYGYFEGVGERNKKLQMDGYYFDQYDKSCVILISDFSNGENIETLTATEIDRLYGNMRSLVESCINGYILKKGLKRLVMVIH